MMGRSRRRRIAGVAVAVLLAALTTAAGALASRAAGSSALRAMVFQASNRYYGGGASGAEPRRTPLACFKGVISTVVTGSDWGAWTFSAYAEQPTHAQRCHTGNGVAIEHRIHGRWYLLWEGSEGYPPTHATRIGSRTLHGVPRAVAKDLIRGLS